MTPPRTKVFFTFLPSAEIIDIILVVVYYLCSILFNIDEFLSLETNLLSFYLIVFP